MYFISLLSTYLDHNPHFTYTSPTGSPVYFLKNTIFLLLLLFPPSSSIPLANYGGRLEISFSLFLTFPMCLDFSTYNNITCTYGFFFDFDLIVTREQKLRPYLAAVWKMEGNREREKVF